MKGKLRHIAVRVRLGQAIREATEKRGWSLRDLAFSAGIDASNLTRICQGKYGASIDIYERLFNILELSLVPEPLKFDC